MPNYTYKCSLGHQTTTFIRYEDWDKVFDPHEKTCELSLESGLVCLQNALIVFEPTPFTVKAPRDRR